MPEDNRSTRATNSFAALNWPWGNPPRTARPCTCISMASIGACITSWNDRTSRFGAAYFGSDPYSWDGINSGEPINADGDRFRSTRTSQRLAHHAEPGS